MTSKTKQRRSGGKLVLLFLRVPAVSLPMVLFVGCASMGKAPVVDVDDSTTSTSSTVTVQAAPNLAPAVNGFPIGVGDEVKVTVWQYEDLSRTLRVPPGGVIFYPLVGEIKVDGMGTDDLRKRIAQGLGQYMASPQVNVEMANFRSRKIYVLGAVMKPGLLAIEDQATVLDAVMLSGGFTKDADLQKIVVVRAGAFAGEDDEVELDQVNAKASLEGRDRALMTTALADGDVLFVASTSIAKTAQFFGYLGEIVRPFADLSRAIWYFDNYWDGID